jgi:hypothetical protein
MMTMTIFESKKTETTKLKSPAGKNVKCLNIGMRNVVLCKKNNTLMSLQLSLSTSHVDCAVVLYAPPQACQHH